MQSFWLDRPPVILLKICDEGVPPASVFPYTTSDLSSGHYREDITQLVGCVPPCLPPYGWGRALVIRRLLKNGVIIYFKRK